MGAHQGRIRTLLLTILFLIFASAVAAVGVRYANPAIRSELVAFTIDSQTQTTIRFDLSRRDPHLAVTCRVIARDLSTAIVGDKYVEIGSGVVKDLEIREVIPTRSRAVTASVVRCLPKER